jgi:hypothetical protein
VEAGTPADASDNFIKEFTVKPDEILGPFFKKKPPLVESTANLIFTNQTKNAVYNDWLVTAFLLKEPAETAFLVFLKRLDGKKVPLPTGTITVPIHDLRFIEC